MACFSKGVVDDERVVAKDRVGEETEVEGRLCNHQ
jgi:predicted RNA-binding protein